MGSEADLSPLGSSVTQEYTQTIETTTATSKSRRPGGRSAHATWCHGRTARADNGEDISDPKIRYCIHCTEAPIYKSAISTNFRRHLKSAHSINVKTELSPLETKII